MTSREYILWVNNDRLQRWVLLLVYILMAAIAGVTIQFYWPFSCSWLACLVR